MELVWAGVRRLDYLAGYRRGVGDDDVLGRSRSERCIDIARQLRLLGPGATRTQGTQRLHRFPLAPGDDGKEIPVAHDLDDAGRLRRGLTVHRLELGAVARRAHDARVHHAGQAQVVHVSDTAGDLRRNVDALDRLADKAARVAQLRLRCCAHAE